MLDDHDAPFRIKTTTTTDALSKGELGEQISYAAVPWIETPSIRSLSERDTNCPKQKKHSTAHTWLDFLLWSCVLAIHPLSA
jgi:hypothetical protein